MSEWREERLGNLIDIKHGFAFKGEFFSDIPTENILLSPGNFHIGGGFKDDKLKYYSGEFPEDYILKENDVIVTMTDLSKEGDTLGYSAKIPSSSKNIFLHNQRLGLVKSKSNQVDINFIYWLLRTREYQKTIVNSCTGSTVKHTSPGRIQDYSFKLPSLVEEQKAIADVLSCLDAKIENLRSQNQTLEKIAQALFNHWFMDFEFPNDSDEPYKSSGGAMVASELGDIPVGWEVQSLRSVMTLKYGKSLTSETRVNGEYPVIGSNGIVGNHNKFIVDAPGIVIGRKGTIGKVIWIEDNFYPIDTTFYIADCLGCVGLYFHYFLIKNQEFNRLTSDSAVPGLNRETVYCVETVVPNVSIIDRYNSMVKVIFQKINNNSKQIQTLTKTRDTLLPKLMSGQIRVTE